MNGAGSSIENFFVQNGDRKESSQATVAEPKSR